MPGCVLTPLDGSTLAERALPHAVALARGRSGLHSMAAPCPPPPRWLYAPQTVNHRYVRTRRRCRCTFAKLAN